ncbi:metalloprotease TIKI1 isoform X7 [Oryctolagus cuniculus]|uniref:metalloprotease TIKI1 isoform X7 n=1 Tax=Oryctolagus cuniculus TaxID=9986 RepID=UPI0038792A80
MNPRSWFLLQILCLLPTGAVPRREAPASANCELKPQQSDLNSFLWTIKRDPPSYFFGTIHVPYTRVWDFIPDNSKEAFQHSSIVYFELDLTDPYTISALTSCQMLPQGENLQDVLPRDIYCRLKRHLEYVKLMMPSWMTPDQRGKGLYADYLFNAIAGNWERKRPIWVMLMVNSLTEVDIKSRGVPVLDLFLAQEAERLRKQTGAVEKVEEQCHPLNGLNFSQVIFALNQTLLQQESLRAGSLQIPYTTEDLIKHYNCGDLSSVIFSHDSSQVISWATTPCWMFCGAKAMREKSRRPLSQPAPSATVVPEVPAPEALAPEAGLAAHAWLPSHASPPGSVELPGEPERKFRKKRKRPQRKQRLRQFSDLWVRLEESAAVPQFQVPVLDRHISTELQLLHHGHSHHSQMVASSACLSLWTPVFWVLALVFQAETHLL